MDHPDEDHRELPHVDEHTIRISAPRDRVWAALQRHAATLGLPETSPLAKILGTDPPRGFAVSESSPERSLTLAGRHRFSRYELAFEITDGTDGATDLHAHTYAAFPGLHGRIYRALVIGTRAHVLATNRILSAIERRATE